MNQHTVAIPTWNNPAQLRDTLLSLITNTDFTGRIIVINNGKKGLYEQIQGGVPYDLDWIDADSNLGWEGGINEALKHSDSEFFTMLNDDVLFPPASVKFWENTLKWFDLFDTGAVGPASNYVAGWQSAHAFASHPMLSVGYLIGFCLTTRTAFLKDSGGLDASLPGGDDLDLSIRLKDRGLKLVADRRNYLHHHGGQTGTRVRSDWDSQQHQANTYNAIIAKHGLRKWYDTVSAAPTSTHFTNPRANAMKEFTKADNELTKRFYRLCVEPSDMNEHMMTLYRFASLCDSVVETGTNDCTSTTAFLYAQPSRLDCFDIQRFPDVDEIIRLRGKTDFAFHLGDILQTEIPECDFWFCDDLHTGAHVRKELEKHADRARRYIGFHDVALFAERGEDGSEGIWRAISDYMREHPEWELVYLTEKCNGLAIFARVA